MKAVSFEYPLKKIHGFKPTPKQARSFNNGFSKTLTMKQALFYIEEEVSKFKFAQAKLYTDVEYIENERLSRRISDDSTAILEVYYRNKPYVFICDKWALLEHNIYAVHLVLNHISKMVTWGVFNLDQIMPCFTYSNYAVAQDVFSNTGLESSVAQWMKVLGLGPTATMDDAQAVYRRRAKVIAAQGNNEQDMMTLNEAMDMAKKHLA